MSHELPEIKLIVEYLDAKRINSDEYLNKYKELLSIKYKDSKPDLVIASDDDAFQFLLRFHADLFPAIPVVFCGVNNFAESMLSSTEFFTGIVQAPSTGETIDLALKLHPKTNNIVVISDASTTGKAYRDGVKLIEGQYKPLKFSYLDGYNLSHEELLAGIKGLSPDSIVLLTLWAIDKNGTFLPWSEGGPEIVASSPAPIYSLVEGPLPYGIVGGKIQSGWYQGEAAARLALRILIDHEKPSNLDVIKESPNKYIFNYDQLKQWSIPESGLPTGSIVLNKPLSFYGAHKYVLWFTLTILIFLLAVILLQFINIRKRAHLEKAIKESKAKFKAIFKAIADAVVFVDLERRVVMVNPAFTGMLGYQPEEMIGQQPKFIYADPEEFEKQGRLRYNMEAGIDKPVYEIEYRRKDGTVFPAETLGAQVRDAKGEIIGYLGIIRDISERKQIEEKLKDSIQRFEAFYSAAFEGLAITRAGRIIDVNRMICKIYGYEREELIDMEIKNLVAEADRDMVLDKIRSGYALPYEHRGLHKDGSILCLEVHGQETSYQGQPARATAIHDITKHKRAEKEKLNLEARLRRAQKLESLGTLAGGIAHDFNNLLTVIIGNASLALDDLPADNRAKESITSIRKAADRASNLVAQILAFSRHADQKPQPVKLQIIIRETLKLLRATIPSTIEIREDIDPGCATVMADPTQLHQVLTNLATNAVHAMDEKGLLTISLRQMELGVDDLLDRPDMIPGSYVELSVSDTGSGMNKETLERIYDPFFTTKEVGKGTGMGLAMVHGIVNAHHGMITVDSEPGKGSAFHVFFAVADAEELELAREALALPSGSEHILLVDDEEPIVAMWSRILKGLGYEVTSSMSSKEALEIFSSAPGNFDLLITDQTMPQMSGAELSREILEIRPDLPIILCTGYSSKMSPDEAVSLRIREFMMKPLSREKMAMTVRRLLDEK